MAERGRGTEHVLLEEGRRKMRRRWWMSCHQRTGPGCSLATGDSGHCREGKRLQPRMTKEVQTWSRGDGRQEAGFGTRQTWVQIPPSCLCAACVVASDLFLRASVFPLIK